MDFSAHWLLRERPFEATWDARFFFGSRGHLEALNRLIYFVTERTMNACLLSGEIGCGKTLTRAVLAGQLDPQQFVAIALENSGFTFEELVESILRRLDPAQQILPEGRLARRERLASLLEQYHAVGRHLVLLLDEAQDMSAQTLHELRWLTNFNSHGRAYLSLVLIGQSEIRAAVAADAALNQRISLRFHLSALSVSAVPAYLAHRLRVAGHGTGRIFTQDACNYLHAASRGVPREINRLAKLSMEHAWVREERIVDVRGVDAVVKDLAGHQLAVAA